MNLLFDVTSALAADDKVSKTDFAKSYPAVNSNFKWSSLRPHVDAATRTYILRYIDRETYDLIADDTSTSGTIYEVRQLLKKAVAEYAIYICLPKISTVVGDMGAMEQSADQTTPISIAKMKMTQWSCITDGDHALDQALELMEDRLDLFHDWQDSDEYQDATSLFFKNTRQFARYASVTGRRAYLALIPHIRKAEKDLKSILCTEYRSIIRTVGSAVPTDLQVEMIRAIRAYVAAKGMIRGIPKVSMINIGDKYTLVSNTETYSTRSTIVATWLSAQDSLTMSLKEDARDAHQEIIDLLEDNPDIYTDYATEHADMEPRPIIKISDDCVGGVMF